MRRIYIFKISPGSVDCKKHMPVEVQMIDLFCANMYISAVSARKH